MICSSHLCFTYENWIVIEGFCDKNGQPKILINLKIDWTITHESFDQITVTNIDNV